MDNSYSVSVITPVYKTPLSVFRRAYDSVLSQSIGYDCIQWIVVVHNSDEAFLASVTELVGQDVNVLIKVLNDGKHTASAPRNYALHFVEAPYIAFLDADDAYDTDFLKTAVEHMKKSQSQIAVLRREFIRERDCLTVIENTFWSSAIGTLVVEQKDWSYERYFNSVLCGFVSSKVFDASLLKRNHLLFDEKISSQEDVHFCMQAMHLADRLCYIPSCTAYNYYLRDDAYVRTVKKSADEIIRIAEARQTLFERFIMHGSLPDGILSSAFIAVSAYLLYSDLTLDERLAVKRILLPYAEMLEQRHLDDAVCVLVCDAVMHPENLCKSPDKVRSKYKDGVDLIDQMLWGFLKPEGADEK